MSKDKEFKIAEKRSTVQECSAVRVLDRFFRLDFDRYIKELLEARKEGGYE